MRQIVNNHNRVVFDQDESGQDISFIQNEITHEKMLLRVENGVYVLDLVVGPPGYQVAGHERQRPGWWPSTRKSSFTWQG